MRTGSSSRLFKIGKKFCFPDVPSSWVSRTVDSILHFQDHRPKDQILKMGGFDHRTLGKPLPDQMQPLWVRDHTVKDGFTWCMHHYDQVHDCLHEKIDDNEHQIPFTKGDPLPFDLMSLLSPTTNGYDRKRGYLVRNDGLRVEIDTLRGKNILFCCFFVPQFWLDSDRCYAIRRIITAYSNLPKSDYEMVMVAKMRRNWANDEDAFNHFFSAFPSSWLAVPFSDTLSRDKICNSLGLFSDSVGLLVDHHQKVVEHKPSLWYNGLSFPPFFDPEFDYSWWKIHTHLHSNLDSEFVFNINNNAAGANDFVTVGIDLENKVSVFELKDKLVGLYLCYDGTLIRTLNLLSQECKARDQEFHIVLVYLPYRDSSDPLLFQEAINHVLHKLKISANPHWWVSPFNDFVSRRLWEIGLSYYHHDEEDELVILDPKMNIADHLGKYVINRLGINGYPFTRHSLVQRELEAIRAVTLESLLVYGSRDYVLRMNLTNHNDISNGIDEVPIGELRGKHVLLYIDLVETPSDTYYTLLEWYNQNKTARVADFEVVFVHFDGEASTSFGSPKPMPWLVCPFDPQHTVFVKEKILMGCTYKGILAAFDKDGHLITLFAKDLLDSFGPEGFPSYNGLHNEVVLLIGDQYLLEMDDLLDNGPVKGDLFGSLREFQKMAVDYLSTKVFYEANSELDTDNAITFVTVKRVGDSNFVLEST
uniref:Uncharacterized protein n=1 Tax=Chenopodium quinoa TaxID=63459 RepID=A0A803MLP3_CHEQI